jgi:peptidyl-prolyl cis-trans isomerase B (cyclophilin B)
MAGGMLRWGRALTRCAMAVVLIGTVLAGCNRFGGKPKAGGQPKTQAVPKTFSSLEVPAWQKPFKEAVRSEPPPDWPLPDVTKTGKSVGKLYTEVEKNWDSVKFVSDGGKRIVYTATLETDLGNVVLELHPEWAPNHTRNFVVLAKVGYYDGLCFDHMIHQESDVKPEDKLDLVEAGCPLGTGETGTGSIGYWLKPEFNDKVSHEEGTVGFCRAEEPDTAATRFYVTLNKAPFLDNNYTAFARVTQGMDVVRKIYQQPGKVEESDGDGERHPVNPVTINKVTIATKEVDKQGPGADN